MDVSKEASIPTQSRSVEQPITLTNLSKIFRKTNISYYLIRTRTCAYQGVRNVSFSERTDNTKSKCVLYFLLRIQTKETLKKFSTHYGFNCV